MSTNETTTIGAVAFPEKTLSLSALNVIFVEIYGHGGSFFIKDVPLFSLSFSHFEVDGKDQKYNYIEEVCNPFSDHINAPVMTETTYLQDQRVIKIEVKKSDEKRGEIVTGIFGN